MKKNNFAEEYAQETAIKAQYHEAEKAGNTEGQEAARNAYHELEEQIAGKGIPTRESTGFTARHRNGAMRTSI